MRHLHRLCLALLLLQPILDVRSSAQSADSLDRQILDEIRLLRAESKELKDRLGGLAAGLASVRSELNSLKLALGDSSGGLSGERRPRVVARGPSERGAFEEALVDISNDQQKGDPKADLVMIEFSDFECPFCARYAETTMPSLLAEYVDTGKLRYVFKHYPASFHPNARNAARAAICAERQDQFWPMHDVLFANGRALQRERLADYAAEVGLDVDVFESCMNEREIGQRIDRDMADAVEAGFRGTPHFGLGYATEDGSVVRVIQLISGAKQLQEFRSTIDAMLTDVRDLE